VEKPDVEPKLPRKLLKEFNINYRVQGKRFSKYWIFKCGIK